MMLIPGSKSIFIVILLGLIGGVWLAPAPARAAGKLALVLGNSRYEAVPPLGNPANDAADVARTLRALGFDVIERQDATRDAMAHALHDFSERIRTADLALFFYAGHGLQMDGENYLVPVDARIENEADIRFDTINLVDVQREMEGSEHASIIMLDACRNNPFADKLTHGGRGMTGRGLVGIEASGTGSLIVYSTEPNAIALDGLGRNSPFTTALLNHLATPGLEVRQLISRVRGEVLQATGAKQVPWDNSSLVGDVYLAGPPSSSAPPLQNQAASMPEGASLPRTTTLQPQPPSGATPVLTGAAAECERLAAPKVPLAVPAAVEKARVVDWGHAIEVCTAALKDDPQSIQLNYWLGNAYDRAKAYIEAVRHYEIAAEAGYAPAESALGVLVVTGRGVVKNYQRAFELFNKSALGGSPSGMANLGAMYSNGYFVKEDDAKALDWFEKSIEAGYAFGLTQAGIMYYNGKGTPRDYNTAADYFQQAADLGDGYAMKFLAVMVERGLLGKPDAGKAAALRLRAAEVDPDSQTPDVPLPRPAARRASPAHAAYRRVRVRLPLCWPLCGL